MFERLGELWRRILHYWRRAQFDRELQEEMRLHLELKTEQHMAAGMEPEAARYAAQREFGNQLFLREVSRELWGLSWLETTGQDLRYGLRLLRKKPGLTCTIIFTLALGIGANTAIFSVVNAVVLRPLPYAAPERLVMIWETMPDNDRRYVAPGNFADWRTQAQTFEQLAGYAINGVNLTGHGEPERLGCAAVTTNLFATLGVGAFKGRIFVPEDAQRQDGRVVVLSYGLWQRSFGANPNVIGQPLTLDEQSYTVVGVMPASFNFPAEADLWLPGYHDTPVAPSLATQFPNANFPASRDVHFSFVVGRLKPNVTLAQAQAEMNAIAARLAQQYRATNEGLGAHVIQLHQQIVGSVQPILFILLGAVAFVLLIACTNVANILLARFTQRERELAVRVALGASRARLLRQMLTESVLLSLLGGLAGLLLGMWGIALFVKLSPGNIPRLNEVGLDGRLLAFNLLVSVATGIIFGLLPALQATRLDPQRALTESGTKVSGSRRQRRVRNLLVVVEVALAQVLLIGAGLLMISFAHLQEVKPGFNPDKLLTARLALPSEKYADAGRKADFYNQLLERLQALPGVRAAGLVMGLPLTDLNINRGFVVEGRPQPRPGENINVDYQVISPSYFATMEILLLRGRAFTDADDEDRPRVVIIDESMARKYFPGEDPVGQRIALGDPTRQDSWRTIVGVVDNVHYASVDAPPVPTAYTPYRQDRESWTRMAIVLRTNVEPSSLAAALRREVAAVDPNQPVTKVETMTQLMGESVARPKFVMLLLGVLAAVALALAAVGIYGLLSYSITERTREIGIRLALGAQTREVFKLIIGHGLLLALTGISVGLVAAFALTRFLTNLLFGVSATDPLTFASISLLLTFVALLACYLPARKAAKVDPLIALRYE
jgi:putative ABC transport system permease protein